MKNSITWCICLIVFLVSCKDKPEPRPIGNIDNLTGRWVSIDSTVMEKLGRYFYVKDTLTFSKNTTNFLGTFKFFLSRTSEYSVLPGAYYSADYFIPDSLSLEFLGPGKIGMLNNDFRYKVQFNKYKDTLSLIDFRKAYPSSPFYIFYKIK